MAVPETVYPQIIFGEHLGIGMRETPHPNLPYFSILDFPLPRKESTWNKFPSKLYFQPSALIPFTMPICDSAGKPIARKDTPTFAEWDRIIQNHTNSKTILARKTTLTFARLLNPFSMIQTLRKKAANSLVFGIILGPHLAFIGATPELLFKRRGNHLTTEALAGTRVLGKEKELLASAKDLHEFGFVKDEIAEKLASIAKPFSVSKDIHVKKTSHLCHLHYPFEVILKDNISDLDLISFLHPTAAISGSDRALEFIQANEPFDRGWYAGTVGMMTPEESRVYVGIRSAIIDENQMHIFAGAGIVNNSLSYSEWQELENKIKLWM